MKIDELNTYESEQRGEALIFADIPNEAYHAGVGISSSAIRRFGESQLHAIEHVQETTPAMNFGTAAHAMLVEGDEAFVGITDYAQGELGDIVFLEIETEGEELAKEEHKDFSKYIY